MGGKHEANVSTGSTRTLTYTPKGNLLPDFLSYVADFCCVLANDNTVEGKSLNYTSTRVTAVLNHPPTILDSRITGENGRAVFSLNVKDEGGPYNSALIQMYTSMDSLSHYDFGGSRYAQDARFAQKYVFGPLTTTPCMIAVLNSTIDNSTAPYYGTCSSTIHANGFSAYGDYRLKSNIESLDETHTVDNIRVVKYTSNNRKRYHCG